MKPEGSSSYEWGEHSTSTSTSTVARVEAVAERRGRRWWGALPTRWGREDDVAAAEPKVCAAAKAPGGQLGADPPGVTAAAMAPPEGDGLQPEGPACTTATSSSGS